MKKQVVSDKVLHDKTIKIASNCKYDRYQHELVSIVYRCFKIKSSRIENQEMLNELRRFITRKTNTTKD